jgi:hypothetical protein
MPVRKLSKEQWAYEIQRAGHVRDVQRVKIREAKFHYFEHYIGRWMPLPYLIGATAAAMLYILYGPKEFFKFFLSWCVSLTIVMTTGYYIWKYYERQL